MSALNKKNIKNIYELTPLQEGILLHHLNYKLSNPYFEQASFTLEGKIDSNVFIEAWKLTLNRHDIFRTVFAYKKIKTPVQIVLKNCEHDVTFENICDLNKTEQNKKIQHYEKNDIKKGFQIDKIPPVRIKLFKLSDMRNVFIWSFHHILIDGWSLKNIFSEFLEIYNSKTKNKNYILKEPVQFREFVKWLKQQDMKKSLDYWERYLEQCNVATTVPTVLHEDVNYELCEKEFFIDEKFTFQLNEIAKRTGGTLNNIIRTVWGIVIAYFNRTDFAVFGATVSGRPPDLQGVDEIVGLFINAVPVKVGFKSLKEKLFDIYKVVQNEDIYCKEHQYCSLAEIQSKSKLKNNLIDHIFVFENYPESDNNDSSQCFKTVDFKLYEHTNYNFEIQIFPDKKLKFRVRYNENIINKDFVKALDTIINHAINAFIDMKTVEEAFVIFDTELNKFFKRVDIRVAASFVAEEVLPYLKSYLLNFNYLPDIKFAKYNNVFQELVNEHSLIKDNDSGINFIFSRPEDWIRNIKNKTSDFLIEKLDDTFDYFKQLLKSQNFYSTTFVGIFERVNFKEEKLNKKIDSIYKELVEFVKGLTNVFIVDFRKCAEQFGLKKVFDLTKDIAAHIPFTDYYFVAMANEMARRVVTAFGHPFKVIVVDCDNTLWHGVVGESGAENVKIYGGYKWLQKWLVQKYSEGFLIAICSKNEEHDVKAVFNKNKDMILKEEHIVTSRINWNKKSSNLLDIAEELNLGINSFVFIDDSGVECSEVMTELPQIFTLKIGDEKSIPLLIENFWGCDKLKVTEEDKSRTKMYVAERKRKTAAMKLSESEFLKKLGIVIDIHCVKDHEIERASQLTLRTNQFNMNTRRRQIADIKSFLQSDKYFVYVLKVKDNFGDYGIVGLLILEIKREKIFVDTFLLSCRVLGRKVEDTVLQFLKLKMEEFNFDYFEAVFVKSDRNTPFKDFIIRTKWTLKKVTENGEEIYVLNKNKIKDIPDYIDFTIEKELETEDNKSIDVVASEDEIVKKIDRIKVFTVNNKSLLYYKYYTVIGYDTILNVYKISGGTGDCYSFKIKEKATNKTEKSVLDIFKRFLKLQNIGINENFFKIGGHSLLAIRIISALYREFGVEIPVIYFFENPTVKLIADFIKKHIDASKKYIPIPLAPAKKYYELSHAQRRLWILSEMEENFTALNIFDVSVIKGKFNIPIFEKAFNYIMEKHEILRTNITNINGEPKQFIREKVNFKIETEHVNSNREIEKIVEVESSRSFNLENDLLIRIKILKKSNTEYILIFNMHHIIGDGWSLGVMIGELLDCYGKLNAGKTFNFKKLKIQYKDYAYWQNKLLQKGLLDNSRNFWIKQLSGDLPVLEMPTDFKRSNIRSYKGDTYYQYSDEELQGKAEIFCKEFGISKFMLFYAVLKVLLYKYTGNEDIIIGSVVANRNHPDLEDQIGFYVNTLAMRDSISGEYIFSDFLEKVKKRVVESYEHQSYPFDLLVEELDLHRDISRSPLFDIMLVMQNNDGVEFENEEFEIESLRYKRNRSQFDMTFQFFEDEQLYLELNYNKDLYKPKTIQRIVNHYFNLLKEIIDAPAKRIKEYSVMDNEEKNIVINALRGRTVDCNYNRSIPEVLEEIVKKSGKREAVYYQGKSYSYERLWSDSKALCHDIIKRGLKVEDRVGIVAGSSYSDIVSILGVLMSGCCYVPIDNKLPNERIKYIIGDSNIKLLICESSNALSLENSFNIDTIETDKIDYNKKFKLSEKIDLNGDNLAYIIYTSGSTGKPKGVMIEHKGVINLAFGQIEAFGIEKEERILQFANITFDASVSEIFTALFNGASVILIDRNLLNDKEEFIKYLNSASVTMATFPPSFLTNFNPEDFKTLQTVITAGEKPIKRDVKRFSEKFSYINAYGPTEATVCATTFRVPENYDKEDIAIGKPIFNTSLYILDKDLNILPMGVKGEIVIAGAGIARGYVNNHDKNRESFVSLDCGNGNERIYRTGDYGILSDDYNLIFSERKDNQVKIRGFRIEIGDVEAAAEKIKEIKLSAVCYLANEEALILYYSEKKHNILNSEKIRKKLQIWLPYYMIPDYIVKVDNITLNSSGKIDRKNLIETYGKGKRDDDEFVFPKDEFEEKVAQTAKSVLNLERISMNDNFFNIGGNSLKGLKFVEKINKIFGRQVMKLINLYHTPTLKELSSFIKEGGEEIIVINRGNSKKIFCFPYIGLYMDVYFELAKEFGDYEFHIFEFFGKEKFKKNILSYLTEHFDNNSILLGYSAGGNIAFDVASEIAEKDGIMNIVMIDSWLGLEKFNNLNEFFNENHFPESFSYREKFNEFAEIINCINYKKNPFCNLYLIESEDETNEELHRNWHNFAVNVCVKKGKGTHFSMFNKDFFGFNKILLEEVLNEAFD